MCLINFQLNDHPKYKLIIAANRDEFYNRPTAAAAFWNDSPEILAGRDLLQMGTWLGITKTGRIAALTNYRNPDLEEPGKYSRGEIITNYLISNQSPEAYLNALRAKRGDYSGFNLIVGNSEALFYYNNMEDKFDLIPNGTHALSNHFLNTPWPKVVKGRTMLREYSNSHDTVEIEKLFEIVADAEEAGDNDLPQTGITLDLERKLSPLFIQTPDYGTRTSTILLIDKNDQVTFVERTWDKGIFDRDRHFTFPLIKD
ncbi:NRDE family protein [Oceanobacillus massiliensis]|uniref:NRDE family protein n=1 Tax=Oceanobacillus massiliensis TaxID=1465765 RepID=UPI000287EDE7|nr:NRDE family protein [Oceanobacillus massiliensis]